MRQPPANRPPSSPKRQQRRRDLTRPTPASLNAAEIRESCPYDIPRKAEDGTLSKCDMCNDRVENGLPPACVKVCPTGAMNFGDRAEMLDLAQKHLAAAKKEISQRHAAGSR